MAALNHTIVSSRDKVVSATYLSEILGVGPPRLWGPFAVVELANAVSLDYRDTPSGEPIPSTHYAFLVSEGEFDAAFGRIEARQRYWADPALEREGEINRRDGGRGVYFKDPDGHVLELLTRPYGSRG
jgi:catechol 2,3-dioxygenase-like lactoylglutathione lyase family enzyme